jgi:hypothetical protein
VLFFPKYQFAVGGLKMEKKYKLAAFAGIIYLISFIPELTMEIMQEFYAGDGYISALLLVTYIVSTLSTIIFFYGFILLANKYDDNLLYVGSIIIILTTVFYYAYAWFTIDIIEAEEKIMGVAILLLYGFAGIIFGIGLYRLKTVFGSLASAAGILEISIGVFFVTIVLFFFGLILSIPTVIIEVLLLFKAVERAKSSEDQIMVNGQGQVP